MVKIQKILCAVDFSEYSLEALEYATHLVLKEEASLYMVHIVDSRMYDYGGPIYEPGPNVVNTVVNQESIDMLKARLLEKVPEGFQGKVEAAVSFGVPFVEIIKFAKAFDVDLIVMGTHGRSGIAHMLIGSVTEKVVRKAPCPVLSVKVPVK